MKHLVMEELESMLLEAAGRTGSPRRRQREGSYSDGEIESNEDSPEDNPGYATKKPPISEVSLKKRMDPSEKDDGQGILRNNHNYGDDELVSDSDESDVGSDLYKDDNDREKLSQMTELEREMILSERAQRRDDQLLTKMVRTKQTGKKTQPVKGSLNPPSSCVHSSARFSERSAAKDDALNELRTKRLKQVDPDVQHKAKYIKKESFGDSVGERKSIITVESSYSSQSKEENPSQSHNKDEAPAREEDFWYSNEEISNNEETLTFEDIREITIRRSKLATWLTEPFFEELIAGCFVRVGTRMDGNISCYRLFVVKRVDATEPNKKYRLESRSTHKYLTGTWGRVEHKWQMSAISDCPPLEAEFNEWVRAMKHDGLQMPSQREIQEKQEAIQKQTNFIYSSASVKQILEVKRSTSSRPLNIAVEKERLKREMNAAESKQNMAEIERITLRLRELDEARQTKEVNSKALRLAEMNKKNRAENFKNASKIKPVERSLKAGEAGYDPFSRRWTRSRNYYTPNPGGYSEAKAAKGGDVELGVAIEAARGTVLTGMVDLKGTTQPLGAGAGVGKLVHTNSPVDQRRAFNSLHNFELAISLVELQRFGGPQGAHLGYMARKSKIEAAIGCEVPGNDGQRHSLVLTVSDYKRRRGLL